MSPTNPSSNTNKRKRASSTSNTKTTSKKPRSDVDKAAPTEIPAAAADSQSSASADSQEGLCPARAILKENKRKYLIAWAPHPITGEEYEPTWEPKSNANEELVAEWKQVKAAKQASRKGPAKGKAKARARRVPDSSPTPAPFSTSQVIEDSAHTHSASAEPAEDTALEDEATQSVAEQQEERRTVQAIEITRSPGFDPAEYDRFSTQQTVLNNSSSPTGTSQIAGSSIENSSVGDPTTPQSAALSTPTRVEKDRVIPDSEGLSDSYIVSTQTASEPEQPILSQPVQSTTGDALENAVGAQENDGITRRDFAGISQAETVASVGTPSRRTDSPAQASDSSFQPAQIVPASSSTSTAQDDSTDTILPTTEVVQSTPLQSNPSDNDVSPNSLAKSSQPSPHSNSLSYIQNPLLNRRGHQATPLIISPPLRRVNPDTVLRRRSDQDRDIAARISKNIAKNRMEKAAAAKRAQAEQNSIRQPNSPTFSGVPGTRSPSTIPDRAPVQTSQTSLRTTALTNSAMEMSPPARPMAATPAVFVPATSDSNVNARSLTEPQLDKGEYIVPLGLPGLQKSHYQDVVRKFSETADSATPQSINTFLTDLHAAELIIELASPADVWTPENLNVEDFPKYASNISAKFKFLDFVLKALKDKDLHIVLVAYDRALSLLERFLKGKKAHYDYPSELRKSSPEKSEGKLLVTILSTEMDNPVIRYTDMIICLDHTYNKDQVKKLCGNHLTDPNHITPIIHPVIVNSSEHVRYCISSSVSASEKTKILVDCTVQLQDKIGKLPEAFPKVKDPWNEAAAKELARFAVKSAPGNGITFVGWALPSLPPIKDYIHLDDSSPSSSSSMSTSPRQASASLKRSLDVEASEASKKIRLTPQPHDSSNAGDTTRISDSIGGSTQSGTMTHFNLQTAFEAAQDELNTLKSELMLRDTRLKTSEQRKSEVMQSLQDLTNRCEKDRSDIRDLREQLTQATSTINALTAEKMKLIQRLEKKDEELATMTANYESERRSNLASHDSLLSEYTTVRAELETTKAANVRLQKNYDSKAQEFEYLKNQYQSGASTAMEQSKQIDRLEGEKSILERKSAEVRLQMQAASQNKATEALKRENESLKKKNGTLTGQYKALADKQKTLVESSRGVGMGTRQTSVPKSPRVGANGGSRAASPLPGGRIKQLKNS